MTMRRRTHFAASLVAISTTNCATAPEPESAAPRATHVAPGPPEPPRPARPAKLVDEFPSNIRLRSYPRCSDPNARCDVGGPNDPPLETMRVEVHHVRELPDGTARVRFEPPRDPRVDLDWTARAVAGTANVPCEITKRGIEEWQCDAAIDPVALARDGHMLVEPSAFAARQARVPLCSRQGVYCNPPPPKPPSPPAPPPVEPVIARVVRTQVHGGDVLLTVGAGKDRGVRDDWSCAVLRDNTNVPLAGGDCVIIRVDKITTLAKTHLTMDQAYVHTRVRLAPKP